jgi:hypothetical protein
MQGADAQASWRNLGTNIELLTLVGPGLGGVAERSVVEIVGACRSRGPADVDLRSGTGGIKCQREVNFITGTNVAREEIRYQDSAAFTQDTGGLLAFRFDLKNLGLTAGNRRRDARFNCRFHNCRSLGATGPKSQIWANR